MSNRKSFKVTEEQYRLVQLMKRFTKEDFDLLSTIKNNEFTLEDIKALERARATSEENKKKQQLQTIKVNNLMIKRLNRKKDYKQSQVDKKEVLEKNSPDLEALDGKKPIYEIINEIEQINEHINQLNEVNEATQLEYDNSK